LVLFAHTFIKKVFSCTNSSNSSEL